MSHYKQPTSILNSADYQNSLPVKRMLRRNSEHFLKSRIYEKLGISEMK